ncbi:peptidase A2 domain-containing protein [Nephila pilipes]|uniref:Peptidase A2 domain-containing protein n=1 Tax=Nephila pilipes TaxID=299642 RepID=A0A8X6TMC2_NEPPI|nr:peptidase A2 domain-containing protein [Nephila pilipes]
MLDKPAENSNRTLAVTPVSLEIHVVKQNNLNSVEEKLLSEICKLKARIEINSNFLVAVSFYRRIRSKPKSQSAIQNKIHLFAGAIVVLDKIANLRNAFRFAIFRETKAAKNRSDIFSSANVKSPVHS